MIACAAFNQLSSLRSARHAGKPATMRSTGSGSMMTLVAKGRTCVGLHADRRARLNLREVMPRHHHGRGTETVLGEHPCNPRAVVELDHEQIFAVLFTDVRLGNTEGDARNWQQRPRVRRYE